MDLCAQCQFSEPELGTGGFVKTAFAFFVVFFSFLSAACAAPITSHTGLTLERVSFLRLPGWQDDRHGEALAGFHRSCTKLLKLPAKQMYGKGMLAADAKIWHRVCEEALMVDMHDHIAARSFFERMFVPFKAGYQGNFTGKFTGYYEPLMRGSWEKKPGYETPALAPPSDLVPGEIYPLTRTQIETGALSDRNLELMWLASPVDLFFTQVQGSGRVLMDSGETVALRYGGKTNQPYTAIGKVLVERGELTMETVSAPAIRRWLETHPDEAADVMRRNDAYIFFSLGQDVAQGPVGAQNVPLIPERSLAVDTAFFPLGIPLFLSTTLPETPVTDAQDYTRLMVAQDKGSAITGAVRGDVFFGFGERAEALAGHMNQEGTYTVLVPEALARQVEGKRW